MSRIDVSNLGKKYKSYRKRWHRLAEWITAGKNVFHHDQWVLRGISFSIESGEPIGIVGQNGAGKSTLLKILTGTTQLTEGHFSINGRVSALLELGMGFHPEFTGRQNVFMTGQLMGLGNQEIDGLMPQIEDFAEIGNYIDQPTRTYSSGMMIRLAFSAATALRPDVLIVDEALSVGDAYFQHKCFSRIRSYKEKGTSLLFVSHDLVAVKNLCERVILLDQGLMIKDGSPEEVLDYYNAIIAKREANQYIQQIQGEGKRVVTRSGDGAVKIDSVKIFSSGKPVCAVQVGEEIDAHVEVDILKEIPEPNIGFLLRDRLGNDVWGTNTYLMGIRPEKYLPGQKIKAIFHFPANFGVGNYGVTVAFASGPNHLQGNYEWWDQAATLQIIPGNEGGFVGVCYVPVQCGIISCN
jgi:lipopolysaccharide transport system ATP-binding protein